LVYKKVKLGGKFIHKRDIPLYIICAIVGDIIYFYSEYTAMDYLPVSLISIILTLTPMLSVVTERVIYKKKTSFKAVIGIIICVVGVALIIGVDFEVLLQGRLFGYVLAFVCVFTYNVWNFMTASLHEKYDTVTLMLNQMLCVIILLLPYAIYNAPEASEITQTLIWQIVFLALINSGFSFFVTARSLYILGPTTTTLFANFLPVTTTIFGWLILNETISMVQMLGGIIVIIAGYIVIKEKGKAERIVFNKK
jgi:drug/metabolite transporter (DMT)-like permease